MNNVAKFRTGVGFVLLSASMIGISGVIDRVGVGMVNNAIMASLLTVFSALIFTIIYLVLFAQTTSKIFVSFNGKTTYFWLIGLGILGSGIVILLRFFGLREATGTFVSLSQVLTTVITVGLTHYYFEEKLPKMYWFAFPLMLLGMVGVSGGGFKYDDWLFGDWLIVLGSVLLGIANLFAKKASLLGANSYQMVVYRLFFGLVMLIIGVFIFDFNYNIELKMLPLPLIGGFVLAVSYICFYRGMMIIGMNYAISLLMLAPVISMCFEYLLLNELFHKVQVFCMLIVIGCGLLIIYEKEKMLKKNQSG